jgi:outer membrane receptor for monomeric catechols
VQPAELPSWAEQQAAALLTGLGDRWSHIQAVAEQGRQVSAALAPEDRTCLIAAAWLHDVGYESSADAERPAQEEAATEIDEIIVTGQRDYLYRADQSDALGTSIPLAELPATVNVITEDFLEETRAYDIEDV